MPIVPLQAMSALDHFARYHFELQLRLKFREDVGDTFQVFFSRLMSKTHPGDFQPTRPWGSAGDRKCDGYLSSKRTLFQCYAPDELTLADAKAKIIEDFNGALPHQSKFWDNWVFVHNAVDGRLATDIVQLLEELRKQHAMVLISSWGYEEIRRLVFALPINEIVSLLGPPPQLQSFANLGIRDIADVLAQFGGAPSSQTDDLRPTPAGKIEFNRLSEATANLLRIGMSRADLVKRFFDTHPDPELGDRVVALFRAEYAKLREQGESPDHIYDQLFIFTIGPIQTDSVRTVGGYAVLAYLFEQCDIFERPIPPAAT